MASTKSKQQCDDCINLCVDEESGEEYCEMELDEDEMYRFLSGRLNNCPFYHGGSGDCFLSKKQ